MTEAFEYSSNLVNAIAKIKLTVRAQTETEMHPERETWEREPDSDPPAAA